MFPACFAPRTQQMISFTRMAKGSANELACTAGFNLDPRLRVSAVPVAEAIPKGLAVPCWTNLFTRRRNSRASISCRRSSSSSLAAQLDISLDFGFGAIVSELQMLKPGFLDDRLTLQHLTTEGPDPGLRQREVCKIFRMDCQECSDLENKRYRCIQRYLEVIEVRKDGKESEPRLCGGRFGRRVETP
jgi:hypothetical protein